MYILLGGELTMHITQVRIQAEPSPESLQNILFLTNEREHKSTNS